jgi:hypothetical protein
MAILIFSATAFSCPKVLSVMPKNSAYYVISSIDKSIKLVNI